MRDPKGPIPQHGPTWHKPPPPGGLQYALLELIRKHPGINTDELAAKLEVPTGRLRRELGRLHIRRGLIGRQAGLEGALWSSWYSETVE